MDDVTFQNNFRLSRTSFAKLVALLKNLAKNNSKFRRAIPLDKRVAIALYALGSSAEYRSIGNLFGVGKSTVCTILIDFCKEAWAVLQPKYLKNFPLNQSKLEELRKGFDALGFPQCWGALGKLQ